VNKHVQAILDTVEEMRNGHEGCVTDLKCGSCFRCDFDKAVDRWRDQNKPLTDDGYAGDFYRTDYVVEGEDEFPHDMLRYAVSWPKDESDARAMGEGQGRRRRVTLTKYHRDPKPHLAEDRWLSKFRWKVVEVLDTVRD